jgi:hypothetical protein
LARTIYDVYRWSIRRSRVFLSPLLLEHRVDTILEGCMRTSVTRGDVRTRFERSLARVAFALLLLLGGATSFILLGCGAQPPSETEAKPAILLARAFPEQAQKVLHGNEAFVPAGDGFGLPFAGDPAVATGRRGGLSAAFPKRGEEPIRFHLLGGFEFRAREIGASGEGSLTEGAVAYSRQDGTSFWTPTQEGYEEWLHLQAGVATGRAPVAEWEIEGAQLREAGEAVEIADGAGAVHLRVTAPAAFAKGGRRVDARLAVRGARIELWVDAGGEQALVDPVWTPAASMSTSRSGHAAVLLGNGKILVIGGFNGTYLASAELYDLTANSWTSAASMSFARSGATATLLASGNVLVTGGVIARRR